MTEAPSLLRAWESFFVIVGSTAGALTGLQFVVLTLISESGRVRGSAETLAAFASPNVVHFCTALLVSAVFAAPWPALGAPGIAVAIVGLAGIVYTLAVLRRAMRQRDYAPVFDDWLWHTVLPLAAYAAMLAAGIALGAAALSALYAVGGAALLLVFVGIHNAWDTVTYVMVTRPRAARAERREDAPAQTAPEARPPRKRHPRS